jgi:hypothetical protein
MCFPVTIRKVEDIELVSESGFATDTGGFASSISGANFTFGNTLDGKDNVLFATFDGSGLLGLNFSTSDVAIGDVVTYSFDVYWASTNTGGLPNLRIRSGNTNIGHTDVPMPSEDSWYTFSGQFTVTSNTPTALTFVAADSSGLTTGDVFAIANGSYGKQQDAGDTTATTLGGFLTEDVTALYDAEDGTTSGWVKSDFGGSSTSISNVTSGAISGTRSIQIDITSGSTSTGYPRVRRSTSNELSLSAGLQYRIKCKLKLTSGAAKVFARLGSSSGNTAFGSQTLVVGEVIEVDNTFTPSSIGGSANNIEFVFDGTLGTGTILVDDLELTALNHDGTVVTWYDQSVNGYHATQDTAGDQPKIAEAGSLLDDIDFAGSKYLQTTSLQEQIPVSFFCVNRFDSTLTGFRPFIGNGVLDGSSQGYGLFYNDPSNTFRTQVRIPSVSSNLDNTATTVGGVNSLTTNRS